MSATQTLTLERPVATQTMTLERPAVESGLPFALGSRLTSLSFLNHRPDFLTTPVSPPRRTNFKTPASDFDSQIAIAVIGGQYKVTPPCPNPDTPPNPDTSPSPVTPLETIIETTPSPVTLETTSNTPPPFDIHDSLNLATQSKLNRFLFAPHATARPTSVEWSSHTDANSFYNVSALAHWPSKDSYTLWAATSGFQAWWDNLDPEVCPHGWFLEVFFPNAGRMSGEITSEEREDPEVMRARLPISARGDKLRGKKAGRGPVVSGDAVLCERIRVQGRRNLVVVRAGQDYSTSNETERREIEAAKAILKGQAEDLVNTAPGCYSCRYMDSVDPSTGESFPDVMDGQELRQRPRPAVQEFYELMVLKREQQMFEYICCSVGTGMLVTHREETSCLVM